MKENKRLCCFIDGPAHKTAEEAAAAPPPPPEARCHNLAEWEIWDLVDPHDLTDSCSAHLGEMMTDAPEHHIYKIDEDGTSVTCPNG